jgi:hypothetical protein
LLDRLGFAHLDLKIARAFYYHFVVYIVINVLLFVIWFFTFRGFPWFVFPLAGWGVGVFFHFLAVFVFPGRGALERMTEREYEELKRKR